MREAHLGADPFVNGRGGMLVNCSDDTAPRRAMNKIMSQRFDPQQVCDRHRYGHATDRLHSMDQASRQREAA